MRPQPWSSAVGEVVLVGHSTRVRSSPGWPICGPARIAALVHLDAFLPRDGDCCWAMTNDEQREWYATGCAQTSYGVDLLPFQLKLVRFRIAQRCGWRRGVPYQPQ